MKNLDLYAKIEPYLDLEEATYTLHKEFMRFIMENSLDNILDIGCGRGYFLENLRINGLNYLGIDNSLEQIKVCKDKSLNAENLELKKIDQIFDCTVAIFDVVNFVEKQKIEEFFKNIYSLLNKNGYFLFDINTLFAFENIAQGSINIDLEDSFIAINSDFIDSKLITNFFLFEKEEDNKFVKNEGLISQEYYKTNYLEKILKNVGFEIVEKRDLFLYTNNKADKKMFICKKI
ncbi:class I SAM-dependent DNA methyltransferase [Aliarcobacter cibarius]|uniref:Methyltransferase n=1 Tax=Aliarcobacter cibarius TaxID=255507 RepID=A0A7L5JRY0_9BACT|nr:class I SAM-dependent methyltransferase [Aliarcobacter cibarius]QKJ27778.1 methyltransferase [Aliarcobacter cibarius]TLT04962.1 class I SAM-dependent methyltransferase [Aliarcobacter cibarius]